MKSRIRAETWLAVRHASDLLWEPKLGPQRFFERLLEETWRRSVLNLMEA